MNPELQASFRLFAQDRIRYPLMGCEKSSLKHIFKAYNRWIVGSGHKRMNISQLEKLCTDRFGSPNDKHEYGRVLVFIDEEDLEDFDKHADLANLTGGYPFMPYVKAFPTEKLATHILASEDKTSLVEQIINNVRELDSTKDSLKEDIIRLESQLKQKKDYIERLHNKIALLYLSLPEK